MLDSLPKHYQEKWLDMTPGKRFCDPEELKGVSRGADLREIITDARRRLCSWRRCVSCK